MWFSIAKLRQIFDIIGFINIFYSFKSFAGLAQDTGMEESQCVWIANLYQAHNYTLFVTFSYH